MVENDHSRPEWLIVVGTSAGGLEALEQLLIPLPHNLRAAIVVAQHLPSEPRSMVPELLQRRLKLQVQTIQDGMPLRSGCVYLQPFGIEVQVSGDHLRLQSGHRVPPVTIDGLFESAGHHYRDQAIGVIMSGGGSDGSRGCEALRASGGRVLVQQPTEAAFPSMPRAVIQNNAADEVLPLRQITEQLIVITGVENAMSDEQIMAQPYLSRLIEILLARKDVDFRGYRTMPLLRRLNRLAQNEQLPLHHWLAQLLEDPSTVDGIVDQMLVGTTSFFRDAHGWERLRERLFPALIGRRHLRFWSAGCSTGEEAYTLAIWAHDYFRKHSPETEIKVFATDIRGSAVAFAQSGIWPEMALETLPEPLRHYFEPHSQGRRVLDIIRRQIVFTRHNLLQDPPFINLDLILCRNMLIYLERPLQADVIRRFAFTLRMGGHLWLGESETLHNPFFRLIDRKEKLFERIQGPGNALVRPSQRRRENRRPLITPRSLDQIGYTALVEQYAPPAALIADNGDLLHAFAGIEKYLTIRPGVTRLRIDTLSKGVLSGVLSAALAEHRKTREVVTYTRVPIDDEVVNVTLRPVEGLVLLTIQATRAYQTPASAQDLNLEGLVTELQAQLLSTQRGLQETVEALQISNEELEATNEELMSSNEELEATNEELQATNEELYAMTAEREARITELMQLGIEQELMMQNAEVAAVFVDERLRLRKILGPIQKFSDLERPDLGEPFGSFLHDHPVTIAIRETLTHAMSSHQLAEQLATLPDGRTILVKAQRLAKSADGAAGACAVLMNVTELTRAHRYLQSILDALPQHIAVLNHEGFIMETNAAWNGFSRDNNGSADGYIGSSYLNVAQSSGDPAFYQALRGVLSGERDELALEYPCDSPDERRRFLMVGRQIPGGAVLSHQDITRRWEHEQEIRDERDMLWKALLALPMPAALLRLPMGRVSTANKALEELTGFSSEQMNNSAIDLVLNRGTSEGWGTLLKQLDDAPHVQVAAPHGWQTHLQKINATSALLCMVPASMGDPSHEVVGTLASGIAHELNNLLMVISGLVESSLEEETIRAPVLEDLRHALAASQRGGEITRDLLHFARSDNQKPEPIQLSQIAREMVLLLRRSAPSNIALTIRGPAEGPLISGRRAALGQALMNVVLNAFDAMPDGGAIEVRLRDASEVERSRLPSPADQATVLEVRDTGVGMDAEILRRATQPFFTTKSPTSGTGIGLAMVEGVIRASGGVLELESEKNVGTTIRWILPVLDAAAEPLKLPKPIPSVSREEAPQLSVLLVDDNPLVLRSTGRLLERMGVRFLGCERGRDALERFEHFQPDAAVLDMRMPDIDGLELMAMLRARRPSLPVLLYSGNQPPQLDTLQDTHTRFLIKPIRGQVLLDTLHDMLRDVSASDVSASDAQPSASR
ncbi:MAG: chemotaxis protein CheB [Myxococcota bacterium]